MTGKICVNCRKPIKDLYKTYSSNVIKIRECDICKEIADKYVEFEQIIVFIDLALLQTAAYRHVLFNTDFKRYWKYSIILICIEAYLKWNSVFYGDDGHQYQFATGDEKGFYISCLFVLVEHFLFFVLLYGFMRVLRYHCSIALLWKAMTLSNFSKLLFVPIMIWRESSNLELKLNYLIILCYLTLSLICSLSVVSQMSRIRTTILIVLSMVLRRVCMTGLEVTIFS